MATKIVYYRESVFQSIGADIFSACSVLGMFWANSVWIDSAWLNALIFIMALALIIGRGMSKGREFTSFPAAIEALQKDYDAERGKKTL